jgi:hypothetical protein
MANMSTSLPVPESLLPYLTGQLHDYSSLQDSIVIFNVIFGALTVVALGLRIWVRMFMIRAAGVDDGKLQHVEKMLGIHSANHFKCSLSSPSSRLGCSLAHACTGGHMD